jgi:hypothetical protein
MPGMADREALCSLASSVVLVLIDGDGVGI